MRRQALTKSGFSESQRNDLAALFHKAIVSRPWTSERLERAIDALDRIVLEANEGLYSTARRKKANDASQKFRELYASLDAETKDGKYGIDLVFGRSFGELMRRVPNDGMGERNHHARRGRPRNQDQESIAYHVGYTLIRFGIRGRGKHVLSRARSGVYAQCVRFVLRAAGFPVPDDMFPLISKVAPDVEYDGEHCQRPGYAAQYHELKGLKQQKP
jgi:hypothetical protein